MFFSNCQVQLPHMWLMASKFRVLTNLNHLTGHESCNFKLLSRNVLNYGGLKMASKVKTQNKKLASTSKKMKSTQLATDYVSGANPAHEAGHKKMNLKNEFGKASGDRLRAQKLSGLEPVNRAESIQRKERPQRRMSHSGK